MRLKFCALFWLFVGLLVLLGFVVVNALLAIIDDCLGWVERRLDGCLGGLW